MKYDSSNTLVCIDNTKDACLYFDKILPLNLAEIVPWENNGDLEAFQILQKILPPSMLNSTKSFGLSSSVLSYIEAYINVFPVSVGIESQSEEEARKRAKHFFPILIQKKDELFASLPKPVDTIFGTSSHKELTEDPALILTGLKLIDTSKIQWRQIVEIREDKESIAKLRHLRTFIYGNYKDKPIEYIKDDLLNRIEIYETTAKHLGLKTFDSSFKIIFNSGTLVANTAATIASILYKEPVTISASLGINTVLMNDLISPKYQMKLIKDVYDAILVEYKANKDIKYYIDKWYESSGDWNNSWENFSISIKEDKEIDLLQTLHNMQGTDLLKIAIDLGVSTPDFIPSIPTFKNELKSEYRTAYDTFTKAYKQIDSDPSIAIGLANSALESIIKEILKDNRISSKLNGTETLYKQTSVILKEFNLTDIEHPKEIKTIGNSLLSINQAIDKLRSEKTNFHGKANDEYLISDSIYANFIINSVATVGLFINSYYNTKFPKQVQKVVEYNDELPF